VLNKDEWWYNKSLVPSDEIFTVSIKGVSSFNSTSKGLLGDDTK